ncbi:hypothetical protein [Fulvimarina sp. MAC8]|uniref:hypothetical protein n=1 Tax=Fulvimarina sp. MAC8 TaxID=3162874 RepID=UPI0032EEBE6E
MSDAGRTFHDLRILGGPPPFDGVEANKDMLRSDIPLSRKWTYNPSSWSPTGFNAMGLPTDGEVAESDIEDLRNYVQGLEANHVVPPAKPDEKTEEKEDGPTKASVKGPSGEWGTDEGGVQDEYSTTKMRDLRTGETTTDKKHKVDSDFSGKWKEKPDVTFLEGKAEAKVDGAVRQGSFGDADDVFSGKGSFVSGEASAEAKGSVGNKGIKGSLKAAAKGSLLEGSIKTNQDGFIRSEASGAVMKAEAEVSTEVVLSPDEQTLTGKVGASANLLQGTWGGEFCYTPRRVVNLGVSLYNWAVSEDYEGLDENWDIGICAGGELSGAVGAQASAEAKAQNKGGKMSAEAGAKIGLGLGAGVKGKGSVIGLDKAKGLFGF